MADLTHRQVEALLKTFMEEHGWQQARNERYKFKKGLIDKDEGPLRLVEEDDGSLHFVLKGPNDKPYFTPTFPTPRGAYGAIYPDAVFIKRQPTNDSKIVIAEIKPENVERLEVLKGIGQCIIFFPFEKVKPYLVIPTRWYEILSSVFRELPRLGVITYDHEGKMKLAQRAENKPSN